MKFLAVVLCAVVALTQWEVSEQIAGGTDGTYGDHPSICSLQINSGSSYNHRCGCVIWNAKYVVTAAHCLTLAAHKYRVVVGLHRMNNHDSDQAVYSVQSYVTHTNYDGNAADLLNDIAVVEMGTNITFNSHVAIANFATGGSFVGQSCMLVGWGRLSGRGASPNTVQKVNMTSISNDECKIRWSGISGAAIIPGHICFFEDGKSACRGDEGGPVYCGEYMTGISCRITSSCSGDYPSVYTRVSKFYTWLQSEAGDNE